MTENPDPIDIHVGSRVRQQRTLLGLSQSKLGDALGLTFQQIQKYERGANRIGSSRIYRLSKILNVPVTFFFDEISEDVTSRISRDVDEIQEPFAPDRMSARETLDLVRAYYRIADPKVRKRMFELVKSIARGHLN